MNLTPSNSRATPEPTSRVSLRSAFRTTWKFLRIFELSDPHAIGEVTVGVAELLQASCTRHRSDMSLVGIYVWLCMYVYGIRYTMVRVRRFALRCANLPRSVQFRRCPTFEVVTVYSLYALTEHGRTVRPPPSNIRAVMHTNVHLMLAMVLPGSRFQVPRCMHVMMSVHVQAPLHRSLWECGSVACRAPWPNDLGDGW